MPWTTALDALDDCLGCSATGHQSQPSEKAGVFQIGGVFVPSNHRTIVDKYNNQTNPNDGSKSPYER